MFYKDYKIYCQDVKNSNRRNFTASIKGNLQVIKPNNQLLTRYLGKIHKKTLAGHRFCYYLRANNKKSIPSPLIKKFLTLSPI